MTRNKLRLIALGAIVGAVGFRLASRPAGRRFVKDVLKLGYAVRDAVLGEIARAGEDLADLAAEAKEEYRQSRDRAQAPEDAGTPGEA